VKGYIWLRIAGVYLVIGVLFGMYIGISQQFEMASVHAHINLLGWASLALSGLVYSVYPKAATSGLGVGHFWLHNIGLPVMVVGLYLEVAKVFESPLLISIGGSIAILGIILMAINFFAHVKESNSVSVKADSGKTLKH